MSLVRRHGLVANSQAGKCLGYRQALEYLQKVWGFPSEDKGCPYSLQVHCLQCFPTGWDGCGLGMVNR